MPDRPGAGKVFTPTCTMTAARTVADLAAEANKLLVRSPDKKSDTTCGPMILPVDGAPDWLTDLCREAHGDMFPDDWRYEFIEDALTDLENDDDEAPDLDTLYPYTADRMNWLASNLNRPGYCDEAAEEFGIESEKVLDLIAWGMTQEIRETFDLVKGFLEERAEELEAEVKETDDE